MRLMVAANRKYWAARRSTPNTLPSAAPTNDRSASFVRRAIER